MNLRVCQSGRSASSSSGEGMRSVLLFIVLFSCRSLVCVYGILSYVAEDRESCLTNRQTYSQFLYVSLRRLL